MLTKIALLKLQGDFFEFGIISSGQGFCFSLQDFTFAPAFEKSKVNTY